VIELNVIIIVGYHYYQLHITFYLARLSPYIDEVIGDHVFRRNRSTTDQTFGIHQIVEKKWEHNEAVRQLFIDFKKAYDSVRRKIS
jgi:hypothetical protein